MDGTGIADVTLGLNARMTFRGVAADGGRSGTVFAAREPRRGGDAPRNGTNSGTAVITRTRTQTRKPS